MPTKVCCQDRELEGYWLQTTRTRSKYRASRAAKVGCRAVTYEAVCFDRGEPVHSREPPRTLDHRQSPPPLTTPDRREYALHDWTSLSHTDRESKDQPAWYRVQAQLLGRMCTL